MLEYLRQTLQSSTSSLQPWPQRISGICPLIQWDTADDVGQTTHSKTDVVVTVVGMVVVAVRAAAVIVVVDPRAAAQRPSFVTGQPAHNQLLKCA